MMRRPPRAQHRPRQRHERRRAHDRIGDRRGRRRDGSARLRLRLWKCYDGGPVTLRPGMRRRRQAMARARAADRHEDGSGRRAGEQKLETANLVAAGSILSFEPQGPQPERPRQGGLCLERRRPCSETARREGGAYLCGQHCGAIHASDHRLHPSCGASRPQMRGRSAGRSPSGSRSGILQDVGQGAGTNRRRDGGAREAGVTAPPGYVDTPQALAALIAAVRKESRVAVDTEAASFHRYRVRIYLLQVSSPTQTALIDPLAIADLAPFGGLLTDPHVEKVFHDADYDLRVLDRDYNFRAVRLFDTRIAAQLAGEPAIGLAALLEKYAGVKLDKEHQKADWSRRPLPPEMLAYAADDTRHLLKLRDALRARLTELGRLSWAEEEFRRLEELRWSGPAGEGDAYRRGTGAKTLYPRQLAALRELVGWRESVAQQEDRALFRIIGNDALLAVSRALPKSAGDLSRVPDPPASHARRHAAPLLDAVARARALPEAALPEIERARRPPKDSTLDEPVERLKAVRNRVAQELGIDPGVLCGRPTLEAVARAAPNDRAGLARVGELRRWQAEVLGDALLVAL